MSRLDQYIHDFKVNLMQYLDLNYKYRVFLVELIIEVEVWVKVGTGIDCFPFIDTNSIEMKKIIVKFING